MKRKITSFVIAAIATLIGFASVGACADTIPSKKVSDVWVYYGGPGGDSLHIDVTIKGIKKSYDFEDYHMISKDIVVYSKNGENIVIKKGGWVDYNETYKEGEYTFKRNIYWTRSAYRGGASPAIKVSVIRDGAENALKELSDNRAQHLFYEFNGSTTQTQYGMMVMDGMRGKIKYMILINTRSKTATFINPGTKKTIAITKIKLTSLYRPNDIVNFDLPNGEGTMELDHWGGYAFVKLTAKYVPPTRGPVVPIKVVPTNIPSKAVSDVLVDYHNGESLTIQATIQGAKREWNFAGDIPNDTVIYDQGGEKFYFSKSAGVSYTNNYTEGGFQFKREINWVSIGHIGPARLESRVAIAGAAGKEILMNKLPNNHPEDLKIAYLSQPTGVWTTVIMDGSRGKIKYLVRVDTLKNKAFFLDPITRSVVAVQEITYRTERVPKDSITFDLPKQEGTLNLRLSFNTYSAVLTDKYVPPVRNEATMLAGAEEDNGIRAAGVDLSSANNTIVETAGQKDDAANISVSEGGKLQEPTVAAASLKNGHVAITVSNSGQVQERYMLKNGRLTPVDSRTDKPIGTAQAAQIDKTRSGHSLKMQLRSGEVLCLNFDEQDRIVSSEVVPMEKEQAMDEGEVADPRLDPRPVQEQMLRQLH